MNADREGVEMARGFGGHILRACPLIAPLSLQLLFPPERSLESMRPIAYLMM